VAQERFLLRRRGVQPIAAHVLNLAPTSDNEGRKRRVLPGLKAEASTPREGYSRNPPRRRMSGAAGLPAVHGGEEEVNA
jgi:hypothetical protein